MSGRSILRTRSFLRGFLCLATVVGLATWLGARTRVTQQAGQPSPEFPAPTPEQHRLQSQAFKTGGLRAAAAVTGTFVTNVGFIQGAEPATLNELLGLSHVVLVGWVTSHSMVITVDGKSVVSEYSVTAETVVKGKIEPASLTVLMPGGRVRFSDGSLAQVNTPGFLRPLNDRRYLLFLRRVDLDPSAVSARSPATDFSLTAGALSVWDVTGNPRAKPAGAHNTQLARTIWKSSVSAEGLIARLREQLTGR